MDFLESIRRNKRNSAILLFANFLILALSIASVAYWRGATGSVVAIASSVIAIVSTVGSWYYSDKIVLRASKAQIADPEEWPELCNVVREISIAAGMAVPPRVAIIHDSAPNAFATGRDPEHAVVACTTGLLEIMDREELAGVIAHEIAHVTSRDVTTMTIAATTAGAVALIGDLAWRVGLGGANKKDRGPLAAVALVAVILAPLAALLLKAALSRSRETAADARAVEYTRNPRGLRQALEKLSDNTTVVKNRNTAMAHMWIESPLGGKSRNLFSTHPLITERIENLKKLEGLSY